MSEPKSNNTPLRDVHRAFLLVVLMVLSSAAPLLATPVASAHESAGEIVWSPEGSNDTGWVQLDATGADPNTGAQATTSWTLEFAPGAELSNVSFQIRVNGSDGLMIEEPMMVASDVGLNLLDWRGLGMLGSQDSFAGANPYSGRMSPNSDSGATWTLPSDAVITELIIQALAPVDPVVALEPLELDITSAVSHPLDGRMYLAIEDTIYTLDYSNDPIIIDVLEMNSAVHELVIDTTNNLLHVLTEDDGFFAYSLTDTSEQNGLPLPTSASPTGNDWNFKQFMLATNGFVYAAHDGGIAQWDGTSWTFPMSKTTDGEPLDMLEVNGVLYVSFDDEGVVRWDLNSASALSSWSPAHSLMMLCQARQSDQRL